MFDFIKNLFVKPYTPGLSKDPRSAEKKALDFQHNEITYGTNPVPVIWTEKSPSDWLRGKIRNQDGSSSCVGQGTAKALEMLKGQVYSAHPIYRRRKNFSSTGMWLQDAGDILKNQGTTLESLDLSQNLNENMMNRDITVSTPDKILKYFFATPKNIEEIAQIVRDNKHCVLTFESNYDEWTDIPKYLGGAIKWGHCVCSTDPILWKGEKALVIDESWGPGISIFNAQRVITESFLEARNTGAMYLIENGIIPPVKPVFSFQRDLKYGLTLDSDVKALQAALSYFGYFLTDPQYHLGNYGNMTANSVKKWQLDNNVATIQEINTLGGKSFGPKSRAKMNLMLQ